MTMPVDCEHRVLAWTWRTDVSDDPAIKFEDAQPAVRVKTRPLGVFSILERLFRGRIRTPPLRWGFVVILALGVVNIPWEGHAAEGASRPVASETSSDVRTPQTHEIKALRDVLQFVPGVLKVHTGDTVKWVNDGEKTHVLASIPGAGTNDKELFSPMLKPGDTWSHTFEKEGDYPYFCFIHSQMMGAVIVDAPVTDKPTVPPVSP